ncbi:MAG: collagen binding domain-containing protein [Blastocatellia bacterium]
MFFSARFSICLLVALTVSALAQQPNAQPGTATVTGTVKLGDTPAPNIPVALQAEQMGRQGGGRQQPGQQANQQDTTLQTSTDENGVFRFSGVTAGRFRVTLMTETYVNAAANQSANQSATPSAPTLPPAPFAAPSFGADNTKSITISEGQTVSGIDFTLARGGVITGKLTDHNDRPLIAERINLMTMDASGQPRQSNAGNRFGLETDDRGVYRAYGLPPGKYMVSAGNDGGGNRNAPGAIRRATYARTYHPGATEVAEAQVIELTAGSVAENINIRMGAPLKTYAVTGKVVDAQGGEPVAGVTIAITREARNARGGGPPQGGFSGASNDKGEFSVSGLMPGRYSATVQANTFSGGMTVSSEHYGETASFEISDDDTSGVEVRAHRGASIAGVVTVEGSNDPAILSRLSQLMVFASARTQQSGQGQQRQAPGQNMSGGNGMAQVLPNGTFRISGLAPGLVRVTVNGGGGFGGVGAFKLIRIERNGAPSNGDVELTSGEAVGGIRVVVGYGSATIQGRVVINGPLNGGRVMVTARAMNSAAAAGGGGNFPARLSPDGQFSIENLLPGSYEVRATVMIAGQGGGRGGRPGQTGQGQVQVKMPEDRRTVTVANGSPTTLTLTLNLTQ